MLIEFSVENFLSIKDKVTLCMVPGSSTANDEATKSNVQHSAQNSKINLLKTCAIYGANASGKSNLLNAILFARWYILRSSYENFLDNKHFPHPQFKLDDQYSNRPTTFEFSILHNGVRYLYGFSTNMKSVLDEWFYSYPLNQPRLIFNRTTGKNGKYIFNRGSGWKGPWKSITKMTRNDALFLSVSSSFNNEITNPIVGWFNNNLRTVDTTPTRGFELNFTNMLVHESKAIKRNILDLLKKADFSIEDIDVIKRPFNKYRDEAILLDEDAPDEINDEILSTMNTFALETKHPGIDKRGKKKLVSMDYHEESDGTKKFYALSGPINYVISEGCTLIADELDVKMHPLLTRAIVELFHDPKKNPKGAQLIFATHDVSLLDKNLFRRDQIWFTEKKRDGSTDLFSLWDIKARRNEDFKKRYLQGSYGAIPFIEDL